MRTAKSVAEVVGSGLCIGCGLCEAMTGGRIKMKMAPIGGMRPSLTDGFSAEEEAKILSACPGTTAIARTSGTPQTDVIWGAYSTMRYAWAAHQDVRFKAATGGVLTALSAHLLESGKADFILQTAADPQQPMRSTWVISETPSEVLARAGSRYGPTAPLAGLNQALERDRPFALVAKPCDVGAVHALSRSDPRINKLCVVRMVMVCGGQSRLGKSLSLLSEFGVEEDEVSLFRYRGHGNPGLTTIKTKDGREFHKTYNELWEDEGSWELETRCKVCPDALGEAADIAAADVWPGGGPSGEDEGFNGIIVRSKVGERVVQSAAKAGHLVLGEQITPREFDEFQPHQVRKKHAVAARLEGLAQSGLPRIETTGLRTQETGECLSEEQRDSQIQGMKTRVVSGKVKETF